MFKTLFLAVALSFCSLIYELLLAKGFLLVTDNVVVAQTVSIGLYLLGVGFGVFFQNRKEANLNSFFKVEFILSFLGFSIPFFIFGFNLVTEVFLKAHVDNLLVIKFLVFSTLPLLVGFLTGREFMLLVFKGEKDNVNLNHILAATYFGNLLGGLAFPLILYETLGFVGTCFLIASLNMLIAILLIIRKMNYIKAALTITASFALVFLSSNQKTISETLKSFSYVDISTPEVSLEAIKNIWYYFKYDSPKVESFRSKYQDIDLVSFSPNETTLYLNRKPQFSTNNYKSYHISMLEGFINLHGKVPKEVLILGGGDGVLARYLLERGVETVEIIDLDPFITHLAKTHAVFLELNMGALLDKRVAVKNGDAFSYMMSNKRKFEAVFIDFPLPTHLDLSKLYSSEFYSKVFGSLTDSGSVIFDSPAKIEFDFKKPKYSSQSLNLITKTLESAEIKNYIGYGPHEAFFFFTKQNKNLKFDYNLLPEKLPGYVLLNLIPLETYVDIKPTRYENSIFKPVRFD